MQSIEDIFTHVSKRNENDLKIFVDKNILDNLIGDSTRLTQILFNLVGNACKYTQNGKIDVYSSCLPIQDYGHCRILFTIEDNGKGIADNMLDHVFETFAQANDSSSPYARQYEGAGLGLPLVKRLVNLLGGNACVASEAGQGTTFYVSLPFKVPGLLEDKVSAYHPKKIANYKQYKILLADDESSTQMYIRRLLEKQGYAVNDGDQAIKELEGRQFDCILMDIQMPVLDGVEASKQIRSSKSKFKEIPIIALTAYAMTGDREKFLDAGMNDYISKPVDKNELLEVLNRNLPA
jgi:CheY-like chemotaxis protein